jgi:DNA polymerase-3 subunit chi
MTDRHCTVRLPCRRLFAAQDGGHTFSKVGIISETDMGSDATDTEVMFYHLDGEPLERALARLLERTLERGWRAVVQVGAQERLEALDDALWTYRPDSFLPHGRARDGYADAQPIFLTTGDDTPNGAGVRFVVDGARPAAFTGFVRIILLFDGRDPDALAAARAQWKTAKATGAKVTYWQQSDAGRWEQKA